MLLTVLLFHLHFKIKLNLTFIYIQGLHPRILTEGFELAKAKALEILEAYKIPVESKKDILLNVARTSLRTKVHQQLADLLTEVCVDAVLTIKEEGKAVFAC